MRFDEEEIRDIEWAQLVLLGLRPDDIETMNRHQIAVILAVHKVQHER